MPFILLSAQHSSKVGVRRWEHKQSFLCSNLVSDVARRFGIFLCGSCILHFVFLPPLYKQNARLSRKAAKFVRQMPQKDAHTRQKRPHAPSICAKQCRKASLCVKRFFLTNRQRDGIINNRLIVVTTFLTGRVLAVPDRSRQQERDFMERVGCLFAN